MADIIDKIFNRTNPNPKPAPFPIPQGPPRTAPSFPGQAPIDKPVVAAPVVVGASQPVPVSPESYWSSLSTDQKVQALLEAVQELEKNNQELRAELDGINAGVSSAWSDLNEKLQSHTHLMNGEYVVLRGNEE